MPKTLRDFLKGLIAKSGVTLEGDEATNFLAAPSLDAEIPDAVFTGIDNNLISLKDAKNNHPEIKNFYQKQSLDTIDTGLLTIMEDFGIDEILKNEVLAERSTYKRVPLLVKKIRELESKKLEATSKSDKTSLQKEIDELRAQLRLKDSEKDAQKKDFDKRIKQFRIQTALDGLLNKYQTIFDNAAAPLDSEVRATTLRNLLDKELMDAGATIDFDDFGKLLLLKNDGGNYYGDNNQQVSPSQFAEKMLSRNKLLVVTPPATAQGGKQSANQTSYQQQMNAQNANNANGKDKQGNSTLQALISEQLKNIDDGSKVAIM